MTVRACNPRSSLATILCGALALDCGFFMPQDNRTANNDDVDVDFSDNNPSNNDSSDPQSPKGTSSSDDSDSTPNSPTCRELEAKTRSVLSFACAGCHSPGGSGSKNGFDYVLNIGQMIETKKIAPHKASDSPIYLRMLDQSMPPKDVGPRPTSDEVKTIGRWIDTCVATFVSMDQVLGKMRADIIKQNTDDRRFIRYFNLVHLRNSGSSNEELDNVRYALRRTVNSLSREPSITWPEPIDSDKTIYRIDLRDYGWNAATWRTIVDENPFAIEYLEDDADELKLFAEEDVPFVLGDWFVNAGMQPPLYYDVLDVPQTLGGLENQLDIDIRDNIEDGEVERAGFLDSEVSDQNRIIERHELPFANDAALWITYDFAANGGQENIFANPLDFEEDGSEVIFSLPNGMHGYSIVDEDGRRLDAAPDELVVDPEQSDADVVAGISCIGCHEKGINIRDDELRDFVVDSLDFNLNTKRTIEDIHPENRDWKRRLERDQKAYLNALRELKPPKSLTGDGISPVFFEFDENVSLRRAAAEFGVSEAFLRERLTKLNSDIAQLATVDITRDLFSEHFAESVCLLKIGLADDRACD